LLDSKGAAGSGIANLLKPELARGSITVIGATTLEEYRKVIEPEQAFNRRFELLQLREPDLESCCKMIESLADRYEAHHQVKLDPDAIPECVRLARRYIKDKRLPDAALDLLDRTMAAIRMLDEVSMEELTQWKTMYDEITDTAYETEEQALAALRWAYRQLQDRVSPILWGGLVQQPDMTKITDVASFRQMIAEVYEALCAGAAVKREKAGKLELAAVTAAKTGIPIGKIQAGEKEKLLHIEKDLRRRVVGQDHALKALSDAIIESRSGINKPGQPIGSFFLLGPTGTGKTELAKAMAELLFGDEKAMIRFDMSEFKEEHAAALLYGAPPGYVGYEEGGMLVNRIRQQPYSVVLFDEIEKAHASVFDIFLQIMDEGRISDKLGKEGDFSNALILFTSNIASGQIIDCFAEGRVPATSELMQAMAGHFRPEFLGRLTEIVPFGPVTESMAVRIFQIRLQTLTEPLSRLGIGFRISDEAAKMLALSAYDARYGARQISGIIRAQLSRPVSAMIVREEVQKGQEIVVSLQEDGQLLWQVLPIQQVEQVS
jgi:ATP-dependent Clp protease ATP-binding subunit ClpA